VKKPITQETSVTEENPDQPRCEGVIDVGFNKIEASGQTLGRSKVPKTGRKARYDEVVNDPRDGRIEVGNFTV
jgi:hypothetical protein